MLAHQPFKIVTSLPSSKKKTLVFSIFSAQQNGYKGILARSNLQASKGQKAKMNGNVLTLAKIPTPDGS